MTPPKGLPPRPTQNSQSESINSNSFEARLQKLKDFNVLKDIDTKNEDSSIANSINNIESLLNKTGRRSIEDTKAIAREFLNIEKSIDIAIKDAKNISILIALLEIKQELNPTLHIPTILVILNRIKLYAPNGMEEKVIKKVQSAVQGGITESEMESIARSMGNDYYDIYINHKNDISTLDPKTGDFLEQLRQEERKNKLKEEQDKNNKILSKETLEAIEAIDIDGSVKNSEDFFIKLGKLKATISKSKEYKNSTDAEKENIMDWLNSFENEVQKTKESSVNFMNDKFDKLAQQVDRQKDTPGESIEINLGDNMSVDFNTKKEAFEFIKMMKKEAEDDFESIWKEIAAGIGGVAGIGKFLLWTIPSKGLLLTPKALFTPANFSNENDAGWFLTGSLYIIAGVGSWNYIETLHRRILKDTAARFVGAGEGLGSGLRIPDYGRSDQSFFPSDEKMEAQMRNEYLQRIEAIEKLRIYGKGLKPKDRVRFEKEFQKVQSYLNINTDTFWLKAQSLKKDHSVFKRGWRSLSGNGSPILRAGFTGIAYRNSATREFNLSNAIGTIKGGLGYVFENVTAEENDKGKITVNTPEKIIEKPVIIHIKEYIYTRRDLAPEEKKRRIDMITTFIDGLREKPMGKAYIKSRLYDIAHEGYLSQDDIKGKIDGMIKERFPFLDDDNNLKPNATYAEKWDHLQMKIEKGTIGIRPAVLTSGDSMLFKFAHLVEHKRWEGNAEHLEEVFERIKSGRLEISHLYKGTPLKLAADSAKSMFSRYGLTSPQITELIRYSDGIDNVKFNKMVEMGEDGIKFRKGAKAILDDGLKIDGEWRDPLRAIKNYIKFEVDNTEEKILTKKLNTLIKEIKDDEQFYNKIDLFRELHKLVNGYYTTHTVLDELNKHIKKEGISKSQKSNIQKFMDLAETGNLNFTEHDLEALKKGNLTYDEAGHYVGSDFGETEQKAFIQELKSIERLDEVAYRQDIGMPDNLKSAEEGLQNRYDTEIKLVDILYKTHPDTRGTTFSVAKEIKAFAPYILDHEYTRGQVKIVLEQIFDGATLTEIVGEDGKKIDDITSDKSIDPKDSFDIKADVFEATRSMYDSLETEAQKHQMIDRISEANISRGDLPTNIKDALEARTSEGKKMAREEAQANEKDAKKARKKGEIKARLEIADEKLSLYMNSLGELLVSDKKTIKAEIERGENLAYFQEKYHGKPFLTGLELIFTQSASAEPDAHSPWDPVPKDIPAAETDVNTSEAVKGNNSEIDMSPDKVKSEKARIDKIFERITLEIMLDDNLTDSAREEKTQLLYNERRKSKTTTGFKDLSGKTTRELINGYTGENSIVNKIRTLSDIKKEIRDILELPEDTKITSYHINEIAEAGKDNKKFSDISTTIKASIDTSIKGEITEAIKKGPRR